METCRTCAKCDFEDDVNWLDIFHPTRWKNELHHIRVEFTNWKLEISPNDGLPQKICTDCFSKFCNVYTLRMQCEEAQMKLRNIFDKIETPSLGENDDVEHEAQEPMNGFIDHESNINMDIGLAMGMHMEGEESVMRDEQMLRDNSSTNANNMNEKNLLLDMFALCADNNFMDNLNEAVTAASITVMPSGPLDNFRGVHEDDLRSPQQNPPREQIEVSATTLATTYNTATNECCSNDTNILPFPPPPPESPEPPAVGNNGNQNEIIIDEQGEIVQVIDSDNNGDNDGSGDIDIIANIDANEIDMDDGGEDDEEEAQFVQLVEEVIDEYQPSTPPIGQGSGGEEGIGDSSSPAATATITTADGTTLYDFGRGRVSEMPRVYFTFECKYCYKSKHIPGAAFATQESLLAHITAAHNSPHPFNCPYCDVGFLDAASRTVHLKQQHVEKNFTCNVCGKRYADRFNLRHHIEKYHSETDFECDQCDKRFYSRKSLKYHMKWHNPERQLKCSYCDRLFINQRHLKCHEETHTGIRNAEYCTFCGKSFVHLKTLRWHIYRQHGGEKPYKCGHCSEVFASYLDKRLHMLDNHLDNLTSIEKTECMICHKRYENEIDLKEHMMSVDHQQRKPHTLIIANNKRVLQEKSQKRYSGVFFCDVCGQRFNMKSALERHAAVHSTVGRPHGCPKCSKRFKRVQDMNWHMKTHSNEKPNVCDVCGKGFALKYVLNQHKRSHEVLEKNFVCNTCGRAYLFEKSLRVHERVHTGKTYYKCDLCNASFVTHIKFKCHMRKMHDEHLDGDADNGNKELPLDELINIVIT